MLCGFGCVGRPQRREELHEQLFEAIQITTGCWLCFSGHSIQSEWVMTEIRKARKVEQKLQSCFPSG